MGRALVYLGGSRGVLGLCFVLCVISFSWLWLVCNLFSGSASTCSRPQSPGWRACRRRRSGDTHSLRSIIAAAAAARTRLPASARSLRAHRSFLSNAADHARTHAAESVSGSGRTSSSSSGSSSGSGSGPGVLAAAGQHHNANNRATHHCSTTHPDISRAIVRWQGATECRGHAHTGRKQQPQPSSSRRTRRPTMAASSSSRQPQNAAGAQVFDTLFGTRYHTPGAELQLPRKVPMRVEPKSFFANERTFLSWCGMATTMGGVSSAMVGLSMSARGGDGGGAAGAEGRLISRKTVDLVSAVYVPVAILMILYALFAHEWRAKFMRRKQVGFFDDRVGPITLASIVLVTLVAITAMALIDVLS